MLHFKTIPFPLKLFLASLQQSDWFSRSWQSMNEKITQWVKVLPSESAGLEFKLQGVLSPISQCFWWSFSGQKHASGEKCYPLLTDSECALGHTCKQQNNQVTTISCKTQCSTLYKRMATEIISNLHYHLYHRQKLSWYHICHSKNQWNHVHCARSNTKMKTNLKFVDFT